MLQPGWGRQERRDRLGAGQPRHRDLAKAQGRRARLGQQKRLARLGAATKRRGAAPYPFSWKAAISARKGSP